MQEWREERKQERGWMSLLNIGNKKKLEREGLKITEKKYRKNLNYGTDLWMAWGSRTLWDRKKNREGKETEWKGNRRWGRVKVEKPSERV